MAANLWNSRRPSLLLELGQVCLYLCFPSTKWDNDSTYATGLLRGTNEVIYTKKLE